MSAPAQPSRRARLRDVADARPAPHSFRHVRLVDGKHLVHRGLDDRLDLVRDEFHVARHRDQCPARTSVRSFHLAVRADQRKQATTTPRDARDRHVAPSDRQAGERALRSVLLRGRKLCARMRRGMHCTRPSTHANANTAQHVPASESGPGPVASRGNAASRSVHEPAYL